ncbi:hypothetical protein ABW636_03845 [Aquimarina sp. 2201CG1-2-11]|uniref:hypothetical protein n=1 Tax=Aquimarina discodermiae TaxID=3231043 RepID=UPI003462333F
MLSKIQNLKNVKPLSKNQQSTISGGLDFPIDDGCTCVYRDHRGMLAITIITCGSPCPDPNGK